MGWFGHPLVDAYSSPLKHECEQATCHACCGCSDGRPVYGLHCGKADSGAQAATKLQITSPAQTAHGDCLMFQWADLLVCTLAFTSCLATMSTTKSSLTGSTTRAVFCSPVRLPYGNPNKDANKMRVFSVCGYLWLSEQHWIAGSFTPAGLWGL